MIKKVIFIPGSLVINVTIIGKKVTIIGKKALEEPLTYYAHI
jgi:hypothetical protein